MFAYAILRCIPSKFGGVLALFSSIVILFSLSFSESQKIKGLTYYGFVKALFWAHVTVFGLLTLAGSWPAEDPYLLLTQFLSFLYFSFYFILRPSRIFWDTLLT